MESLASWNDGSAKRAIVDFVGRVSRFGSGDYVPAEARVAVFDGDGTLWCEKPLPVQVDFLFRRVGEMAIRDPLLATRQPWKAVVEKDYAWLNSVLERHDRGDDTDLKEMAGGLLASYADMTIDEFDAAVRSFLIGAQNPKLGHLYVRCVYQPMVELLRFLDEHGFVSYVISSGGRDFLRVFVELSHGLPPERVIGSAVTLKYRDDGQFGTLVRTPALGLFNEGSEKPVAVWEALGRRPLLGAGNANGDIPLLHFCALPTRPSLALLVEHDDEAREFSYVTGAEEALALGRKNGWTIASVKDDWKTVFDI